jgi:hypothetical protein
MMPMDHHVIHKTPFFLPRRLHLLFQLSDNSPFQKFASVAEAAAIYLSIFWPMERMRTVCVFSRRVFGGYGLKGKHHPLLGMRL